jgi:hypothetical protein
MTKNLLRVLSKLQQPGKQAEQLACRLIQRMSRVCPHHGARSRRRSSIHRAIRCRRFDHRCQPRRAGNAKVGRTQQLRPTPGHCLGTAFKLVGGQRHTHHGLAAVRSLQQAATAEHEGSRCSG